MKKHPVLFAVTSSVLIIFTVFTINFLTSWGYKWFIYPTFAALWWPLSTLLAKKETIRLYSVVMSLLTIAFLVLVNLMHGTRHLWFWYPSYVILWWPFSMYLAKRKTAKLYSVVMSLLTFVFLVLINLTNSPNVIWFQYSIFYLIWWPLVMFLGKKAKSVVFAIIGGILFFAYHAFLYWQLTPGVYPWYLELLPLAVLWPVCMALKERARRPGFIIAASLFTLIFYILLNGYLRMTVFGLSF